MSAADPRARAFAEALLRGAPGLGLGLVDAALAERMGRHFSLVVRWNEKVNLTTLTDPEAGAALHGLDSLLFAAHLPPAGRVVDVGSGAGFPGIPLALARPELDWVLLEPLRKRASFLRVALTELGLAEVRVLEAKLGDRLPPQGARGRPVFPAEQIVSRATIPPLELIPLAVPLLAPGGRLVLTAGAGGPSAAAVAVAAAAAGAEHRARATHLLPGGETRVLDVVQRAEAG